MSDALPKLRDDLRVSKQETPEQVYYVVSDPITGKYIRLREPEYVILQSLDGNTSAEQISAVLKTENEVEIPSEAIEKFVVRFDDMLFLETGKGEYALSQASKSATAVQAKKSVLFIKLKAFDPEQLLEWLHTKLRFVFSHYFIALTLVVIVVGTYLLVTLPTSVPYNIIQLFRLTTLATAVLALFTVIVMHEFAHALVCRHYGGRVREMGFLLIYFQPAFYCNLSDSYMFPRKSQKVYTILAGMYFQVFLGSMSIMLWRIIKTGTFVSDALLVVTLVCYGTLIFNINPLLKLDGYYLLTDLTEIPNLRRKAFGYLKHIFVQLVFGVKTSLAEPSRREKKVYLIYSVAALAFSFLLLYIIGKLVLTALVSRWEGLGFLLFAAIIMVIFRPLLMSTARQVSTAVREDAISQISVKRWMTWGALLVALVLVLIFVRTELRVSSSAHLRPIESFSIRAPAENVIKSVYFLGGEHQIRRERVFQLASLDFSVFKLEPLVQDGAQARMGDTLFSVSSNLYRGDLAQVESELAKAIAEHDLLLSDPKAAEIAKAKAEIDETKLKRMSEESDYARAQKMYENGLISEEQWDRAGTDRNVAEQQVQIAESKYDLLKSGPKAEELSIIEADIERLTAKKSYLLEQIESSTFIAPFSGRISSTGIDGEILTLVRTDTIETVIAAPEEDIDVLAVGHKTALKVTGYPTKRFDGIVVKIQETAIADDEQNVFAVTSLVPNTDGLLRPGMSGYAKVYCGKRSLGGKLMRRVVRFFRVEFWSWW
jgi:putative peptide zinc metalloprotease protein